MNSAVSIQPSQAPADEASVRELIDLIDELVSVVAEENLELSKGLPASRAQQLDDKNRLAGMFEQRVAQCALQTASLNVEDRVLREQLMERILSLRIAMDENLVRLRAAIDASNRRIETVMQAIREQIASVSPYGANGRRAAPAASCSTNVRA